VLNQARSMVVCLTANRKVQGQHPVPGSIVRPGNRNLILKATANVRLQVRRYPVATPPNASQTPPHLLSVTLVTLRSLHVVAKPASEV